MLLSYSASAEPAPPRPRGVLLRALLCLVLAGGVAPGWAAGFHESARPDAGVLAADTLGPAAYAEAIRALSQRALDSFGVPGMSVGVIKDGRVVLSEGYGVLERGGRDPVDANTLFAIASNTKAFTGLTLALLAHERPGFSLEDRVTEYLPELRFADSAVTALANVTDLVTHRAGLGTFRGDHLWFKRGLSPKQVIALFPTLELEYPFRAGYGYSNLGFIAAGEVIAAVAAKPWGRVFEERILGPLGMTRTVTSTYALGRAGNFATGHVSRQGDAPIAAVPWQTPGAAGGIWSSSDDMLRWLGCNLAAGVWRGDTLWPASVQRAVWRPHNTFGDAEAFTSYGLGWFMYARGEHRVMTHGGGYDGMYSRVVCVPGEGLGIVVLTNGMTGLASAVANRIRDLYLDAETPAGQADDPGANDWLAAALTRQRDGDRAWRERQDSVGHRLRAAAGRPSVAPLRAGAYTDPAFGTFVVESAGGALSLEFPASGQLGARLRPVGGDAYELTWDERHAWFDRGLAYVTRGPDGREALRLYIPNDDIFYDSVRAVREPD